MKNKIWLTLAASAFVCLAGCAKDDPKKEPEPKEEIVPVFVMTGQSNMEGSTYWTYKGKNLVEEYVAEIGGDYSVIENGIQNVVCSNYGFYYPNGWNQAHSSSPDQSSAVARLTPNFRPTTVGMGVGDGGKDEYFGPELGLAYKLTENYDGEEPVHLIKCAFSGSGFEKTDGATWKAREDATLSEEENAAKSLYYILKRYTNNCLKVIEDQGKKPVIKGLIWHQGESDTGNANYQTQMEELIKDFRADYANYATDGNGKKIAFLDCTIYDGSKNRYGSQDNVNNGINKLKNNIAAKGQLDKDDENYEPNFIVDGTFTEHGLSLEIGDEAKGGYNLYHYNTKDAFILGEAYADLIINNNLLD